MIVCLLNRSVEETNDVTIYVAAGKKISRTPVTERGGRLILYIFEKLLSYNEVFSVEINKSVY